ncbi:glucose 1-dehydrogenase [Chelatococcus sp. SYSU_G07232]|uniref:Glucose 1-dehydrogenase n=1 Tax=Chelatococcus albus TaxID=3047466 RepID=A0ABT7ACQ9_9HYPH|nr:glucose 1-dehydrogenase [Chelatococcus sp. SYSU_G07232]MDJ1156787.1 glucose 1-dehydrogenase [Chelatococcus sp. SYSU_G07232]
MMDPHRLSGRFALVTGASRGIGRAVAERFAFEGATVAVNHIGDDSAAEEALAAVAAASQEGGHPPRSHRIAPADVSSAAEVERMIAELVAAWGRLDILVNNAGVQAPTPGDTFDEATFARILAVNLNGAAFCARAAIRHFLSRPGGGAVVNTSSVHEVVPKPSFLAYSLSKGALGNLTRTLALEYADRGIRVNAVGPGAVVTDINRAWAGDAQARAAVESHIPMGFAAEPEDIAPVFAFLASDEARYVTGQTLFACGGLTLYGDFKENWAS